MLVIEFIKNRVYSGCKIEWNEYFVCWCMNFSLRLVSNRFLHWCVLKLKKILGKSRIYSISSGFYSHSKKTNKDFEGIALLLRSKEILLDIFSFNRRSTSARIQASFEVAALWGYISVFGTQVYQWEFYVYKKRSMKAPELSI